jgi:hypothetical protein
MAGRAYTIDQAISDIEQLDTAALEANVRAAVETVKEGQV